MPRSNPDRLAGGRHVEPAEERENIRRAAEVVAAATQPAPPRTQAPPAPAPTVSRQTLTGSSPGPVWGDVVGPLHPNVYQIVFRVLSQSAPAGRVELRAAMRPDVDWQNDSATAPFARPPVHPGGGEELIPNPSHGATKLTRSIPPTGPPAPRWPQYVRPVCFPSTRREFTATVEIELRRDDE
jgi:hypothetical protein